jgi:hypothetical protein
VNKMLEKEFNYFKNNKESLLLKYANKYIVIKDEEVKGFYETQIEALTDALKQFAPGTFLIQFVSPEPEDYIQKFHSRVNFANPNSNSTISTNH